MIIMALKFPILTLVIFYVHLLYLYVAYNDRMGCPIVFGGEVRLHAIAQQHAWEYILDLLRENFQNDCTRIGRTHYSKQ